MTEDRARQEDSPRGQEWRFRGCCCGIPFGCGSILALLLVGSLLGQYVRPEWVLLLVGAATLFCGALVLANPGGQHPRGEVEGPRGRGE